MEKVDIPLDGRFYSTSAPLGITYQKMIKPGLLLVSADSAGKPNAMAIGVAAIATLPGRPVFIVWVRPSRYTYRLIEESGDFSVKVPRDGMEDIVAYCGTVSGRDHDKVTERNLTAAQSRTISAPIIGECLIHYECEVVDKIDTSPDNMAEHLRKHYQIGNYHRLFFGQILATYADKEIALGSAWRRIKEMFLYERTSGSRRNRN